MNDLINAVDRGQSIRWQFDLLFPRVFFLGVVAIVGTFIMVISVPNVATIGLAVGMSLLLLMWAQEAANDWQARGTINAAIQSLENGKLSLTTEERLTLLKHLPDEREQNHWRFKGYKWAELRRALLIGVDNK